MKKKLLKSLDVIDVRSIVLLLFYISITVVLLKFISVDDLTRQVERAGMLAPIIFLLVYVLQGLLRMPEILFLLAAPILFPLPEALFLYMVGVFLSASLSYFIGNWLHGHKTFFKGFRERYLTNPRVQKFIGDFGVKAIPFFQLFSISFHGVNYLSGYFKVPYRSFIVVVLLTKLVQSCIIFFIMM